MMMLSKRLCAGSASRLWRRRSLPAPQHDTDVRSYHATSRQEILPLVGVAVVLFVGRYSYKALQRMDEEWEEYQWQLLQHEKQHGPVVTSPSKFPDGTLAMDVGSLNMMFSLKKPADKMADVIVTREGARYTFCGILANEDELLVGQRAYEHYYDVPSQYQHEHALPPSKVQLPLLTDELVDTVIQSALTDILERTQTKLDQVRLVMTVPPSDDSMHQPSFLEEAPQHVPEPVAAIWGAQQAQLLSTEEERPVCVVDVGGNTTDASIVKKNVVLKHTCLTRFGGETFVQQIMKCILEEQATEDPSSLSRMYQAAQVAAAEFNNHTRTHIHIPYISMDVQTREPLHVDFDVSRTVVEQSLQDHVHHVLVPNSTKRLSPHMPVPTDLTSLWTSLITHLLEDLHMTPMDVSNVLVVGGGAKQVVFAQSVEKSWTMLTGDSSGVVTPQVGIRSELVALGAASLLPQYHYDAANGLVRDA